MQTGLFSTNLEPTMLHFRPGSLTMFLEEETFLLQSSMANCASVLIIHRYLYKTLVTLSRCYDEIIIPFKKLLNNYILMFTYRAIEHL